MPEVAFPIMSLINSGSEFFVSFANNLTQIRCFSGHQDQVNVVRHEAISPKRDFVFFAGPFEQLEIITIIPMGEKRLLTSVATLGHVMRCAGHNYSGASWHTGDMQGPELFFPLNVN